MKMNNASKTGPGRNGNSLRGSSFMTKMDFPEFMATGLTFILITKKTFSP